MDRKIVTHNDFDGIVSASLCSYALRIKKIVFTSPTGIAKALVPISKEDIVCDLPYPLQCGLWFDHHEGNLKELHLRNINPEGLPGRFAKELSCARVIYGYFLPKIKMPSYFEETVWAADLIDSFSYTSVEEWRKETPWNIINNSIKAIEEYQEGINYFRTLVWLIRESPLEEVAKYQEVLRRYNEYKREEEKMLSIIKESSYFLPSDSEREVVVIDLTRYSKRPLIIKNLAFLLYPEAKAVIKVDNLYTQGRKTNDLSFSMSLSLNFSQSGCVKDIGEIMRKLNMGDGHPGAGAGRMSCNSKQEMLKAKDRILQEILRMWKASNPLPLLSPSKPIAHNNGN